MKIENLINLTPHAVTICGEDRKPIVTIPPSGQVARIEVTRKFYGPLGSDDVGYYIPVYCNERGPVVGLPPAEYLIPKDKDSFEKLYIVSTMVRESLPERIDLVSPGELIRDENGNPVGCVGLVCN